MPHPYRRGTSISRRKQTTISYYRPARRVSRLSAILLKLKKLPRRFLIIMGASAAVVIVGITLIVALGGRDGAVTVTGQSVRPGGTPAPTPTATDPTVALPVRAAALAEPLVTPEPVIARDLSFGAASLSFKEKLINEPCLNGRELFYSAGSGSLDNGEVLKKLYLYDMDTGKETQVSAPTITGGGYYETQMNANWLVWLVTDHHTYNYIYVKNRKTSDAPVKIKNCPNGKPKLRLAGNTLIWMEAVDKGKDQLMMYDLLTQDNMSLFTFTDLNTYGVSAPCIYVAPRGSWPSSSPEASASASPTPSPTPSPSPTPTPSPTSTPSASASPTGASGSTGEDAQNSPGSAELTTVVWAGPDESQTDAQKTADGEHSTIYWVNLGKDAIDENGNIVKSSYSPGTYVHEPEYNGSYFAWIDSNYSMNSSLYLSQPHGTPKLVDKGITTFSLGDGILAYGKQQQIWVYVIATGEYCRLTNIGEKAMLPEVNGRTVIWNDKTDNTAADVIRCKTLTDEDIAGGAN